MRRALRDVSPEVRPEDVSRSRRRRWRYRTSRSALASTVRSSSGSAGAPSTSTGTGTPTFACSRPGVRVQPGPPGPRSAPPRPAGPARARARARARGRRVGRGPDAEQDAALELRHDHPGPSGTSRRSRRVERRAPPSRRPARSRRRGRSRRCGAARAPRTGRVQPAQQVGRAGRSSTTCAGGPPSRCRVISADDGPAGSASHCAAPAAAAGHRSARPQRGRAPVRRVAQRGEPQLHVRHDEPGPPACTCSDDPARDVAAVLQQPSLEAHLGRGDGRRRWLRDRRAAAGATSAAATARRAAAHGQRLREGPEVELDDLGVVHEVLAGGGVGVAALVQDVAAVADLQAPAGVLLDHDDRDAGGVDLSAADEDLVLQRGGQARRRLVQQQHRRARA